MKHLLLALVIAACGSSSTAKPVPGITNLDKAPADALVIEVRLYRWRCTFKLGDAQFDELHVPAGRAADLVFTNVDRDALDVELGSKHLAVASHGEGHIAFRADAGVYAWKCPTQQPDVGKSDKPPMLVADTPAGYAMWQDQQNPPPVELGKKIYNTKGCSSCHTVDGSPRVGPSWRGIWGTMVTGDDGTSRKVDENYITESVLHPQAFTVAGYPKAMPTFEGNIRPKEIEGVIAYIKSLANAHAESGSGG